MHVYIGCNRRFACEHCTLLSRSHGKCVALPPLTAPSQCGVTGSGQLDDKLSILTIQTFVGLGIILRAADLVLPGFLDSTHYWCAVFYQRASHLRTHCRKRPLACGYRDPVVKFLLITARVVSGLTKKGVQSTADPIRLHATATRGVDREWHAIMQPIKLYSKLSHQKGCHLCWSLLV